MRIAVLVLVLLGSTAHADKKWGWGGVAIGFGGPLDIKGGLKERMAEERCEDNSCKLTVRASVGGGYGRWSFELGVVNGPTNDTFSMDYRDRERSAFLWGPMARFALVQKWGFTLSVRGGLQHGHVYGDESEMQDVGCDGPCPTSTTYTPPEYGVWSATFGATAQLRLKIDNGYFGLWADADYTMARVSYPDRAVSGELTSRTYGMMFGSMFH